MRISPAVLPILAIVAAGAAPGGRVRDGGPPGPAGVQPSEPAARLVRIDAVVTDRQGRPILDLTPPDFEVVENGVAQKLEAVELRPVGTRVFGLLLDEFHVTSGDASRRVRESFTRFVDDQTRPGDLIAVVKPLDPVTDIRFTSDREAVRRAIAGFEGRKGDYTPRTDFEQKYMGRAPEAVEAGRAQIVLAVLRAMMLRLGELDAGRAALVLVSEGFARPPADDGRRVPDVQGLVRAASRFNVAVYAVDPRVPPRSSGTDPPAGAVLEELPALTGGEAVRAAPDLQPALVRISRDLDSYYLVTYTSSHPADGRFYDVTIRTSRRHARVRARSGYWAPLRTELLSDRAGRSRAPVRSLRRSRLIQTWTGFTVAPDGGPWLTFTWEPASDAPRGAPAAAAVALSVTSERGGVLFEGEIASPRSPARGGRMSVAVVAVPAERLQLDLVIYGRDGTRIDTAAHDLDPPDPSRTDPLILPPQVFRTSSAREFRAILGDPAAAPVPSRTFRRTERLLIRVPAYSASGAEVALSARLVNRRGQVLREIAQVPAAGGMPQFEVPLAPFAPGEYSIELTATSTAGRAREVVRFRLTG